MRALCAFVVLQVLEFEAQTAGETVMLYVLKALNSLVFGKTADAIRQNDTQTQRQFTKAGVALIGGDRVGVIVLQRRRPCATCDHVIGVTFQFGDEGSAEGKVRRYQNRLSRSGWR